MDPQLNVIALGVHDVDRSAEFYARLGCAVQARGAAATVSFGELPARLVLRSWDELADQTGHTSDSRGFRGFMISAIFEDAASVDHLLDRAVRAGGTLTRPAKGAAWGYAGHFIDLDGHAWKAASTGFPLFGRKRSGSRASAGLATPPKEIAATIGVSDIKSAKAFYSDSLGFAVDKSFGKFASFKTADGAPSFSMYTRDALAKDAGAEPTGEGFRGYALGYLASSPSRVDSFIEAGANAGARILSPAKQREGLGYCACIEAPDGAIWTAAVPG